MYKLTLDSFQYHIAVVCILLQGYFKTSGPPTQSFCLMQLFLWTAQRLTTSCLA